MKRLPFAHENLAPPGDKFRGPEFVGRELDALGNNVRMVGNALVRRSDLRRRPKVIALTEAIGHQLPVLEHYERPIRNHKNDGRSNVSLYLRHGLTGPPARWIDHHETWPRTLHPGPHPARATLIKEIDGGPTIVVGHGPPLGPGTGPARAEWVDITAAILRRFPRVVWLGDPNGLLDEVLQELKDERAAVAGDSTDAVLVRGYRLDRVSLPGSVNGVPMLTDHGKVLLGRAVRR